jgi:hypothetical protein
MVLGLACTLTCPPSLWCRSSPRHHPGEPHRTGEREWDRPSNLRCLIPEWHCLRRSRGR